MRKSIALLWVLAAAGCVDPTPVEVVQAPIIGGHTDYADPSVVSLFYAPPGSSYGWLCTGSVVSPHVVLTAAHCVQEAVDGGFADNGRVYWGTEWTSATRRVGIADARYHRRYTDNAMGFWDIALVRLSEAADTEILPINDVTLTDILAKGDTVRAVGFGVEDGINQTGSGTKREVDLTVSGFTTAEMMAGDATRNTCQGDSGGPIFLDVDGTERIVAVTSWGGGGCTSTSYYARTDRYWDEFLVPQMDAWDGPCQLDGTCVTDGCRTPDPDCDPCGLNGVCGENCEQPDWDCPLGKKVGEACATHFECEDRVCLPAADDPSFQYCSRPCDPANVNDKCGVNMECAESGGENLCLYTLPTPGTQGAICQTNAQCHSGLCHPDRYCVNECDPAGAACPEGFECVSSSLAPYVCARPEEGGWCAAARPGHGRGRAPWPGVAAAAAALLGLALVVRRRRRR